MVEFKRDMKPYFIAEVGQNHNGSIQSALEYVRVFAASGASAIKFQTRDNKFLFSDEAYGAPYNSDNAFGETYGEHREFLELSKDELIMLKDECKKLSVDFMSTPFDEPSVDLLMEIGVDLFKVASFDLGNLALIKILIDTGKPIVVSIGGGHKEYVDETIKFLIDHDANFSILHCVSQYPCPPEKLRLSNIDILNEKYSNVCIGSSDHFSGILSGPVAYLRGAKVFEKHVTLNRAQKGTDQAFSLEPKGFSDFIRDIKRVDKMLLNEEPDDLGVEPVFQKLGKSIVAACNIAEGEKLGLKNLSGKIFSEKGTPVREMYKFLGKTLKSEKKMGEKINFSDLNS